MFEILDEVCKPQRATKYSAYVDLFAREDVNIWAGETRIVPLGVKLKLDLSKYGEPFLISNYLEIALRSSLAVKGLIIANGIGIVDLDYPDEIGLIVHNSLDTSYNIKKGDKVAQCTIKEHKSYSMGYESDVVRSGGFGSTNK